MLNCCCAYAPQRRRFANHLLDESAGSVRQPTNDGDRRPHIVRQPIQVESKRMAMSAHRELRLPRPHRSCFKNGRPNKQNCPTLFRVPTVQVATRPGPFGRPTPRGPTQQAQRAKENMPGSPATIVGPATSRCGLTKSRRRSSTTQVRCRGDTRRPAIHGSLDRNLGRYFFSLDFRAAALLSSSCACISSSSAARSWSF